MNPPETLSAVSSMRLLGRICNDLRDSKNKCRNLHFAVDISAYVMQSLRMTTNYKVTVSRAVTATEVREFTVLAEDRERAREIAAMYAAEGCSTCVSPATPVVNVMGMSNQEIKARL